MKYFQNFLLLLIVLIFINTALASKFYIIEIDNNTDFQYHLNDSELLDRVDDPGSGEDIGNQHGNGIRADEKHCLIGQTIPKGKSYLCYRTYRDYKTWRSWAYYNIRGVIKLRGIGKETDTDTGSAQVPTISLKVDFNYLPTYNDKGYKGRLYSTLPYKKLEVLSSELVNVKTNKLISTDLTNCDDSNMDIDKAYCKQMKDIESKISSQKAAARLTLGAGEATGNIVIKTIGLGDISIENEYFGDQLKKAKNDVYCLDEKKTYRLFFSKINSSCLIKHGMINCPKSITYKSMSFQSKKTVVFLCNQTKKQDISCAWIKPSYEGELSSNLNIF